MYSVELITDKASFLAMEPAWNDAVERAAILHPFLRHEWVRAWWDAFGTGHQLHVFVVKHEGRVCAIAPLMFERAQMYGVPIRRLRLLHNDHTPRADVIVVDDPATKDDSYRAIWHAILDDRERWDVLQLGQLAAESRSRSMFTALAGADQCATGLWKSGASPYLTVDTTWPDYHKGLSSKFRQNLRNRLSRLTQIGQPFLEVLREPNDIREALPDAQRLEDSGWKASEGTAIGCDPEVQTFYSLLAERAEECEWLRLMFLTVNGQRIATSLAAEYQNRLFLLKTGYDPQFGKCSPFKLFTYFALMHAFERGMSEVDFLGDPEPWKLEWTSATRAHDWLFVFSDTPRARLLHPLKFQFVPAVKRLQSSAACLSQPSRA